MQNNSLFKVNKIFFGLIGLSTIISCTNRNLNESPKTWNGSSSVSCSDEMCVAAGVYNLLSVLGGGLPLGAFSVDGGFTFTSSYQFTLFDTMLNPNSSTLGYGVINCSNYHCKNHCTSVGTSNFAINLMTGDGASYPFSATSHDGGQNFFANVSQPLLPLGVDTATLNQLAGLTCYDNICVAIGIHSLNIAGGVVQGGLPLIETSHDYGKTFNQASTATLPSDADPDRSAFLYGVSCADNQCVAVGQYNWNPNVFQSYPYATYSPDGGDTFSVASELTLPEDANTVQYSKLRGVTCQNSRCIAVGFYNGMLIPATAKPLVLISNDNGKTFSKSFQPILPDDANPDQITQLTGVGCYDNTCIIVGNYNVTVGIDGPVTGSPLVLVSHDKGETFTTAYKPPVPFDADTSKPILLTGVNCNSVSCVAVGGYNLAYLFSNLAGGFPFSIVSTDNGNTMQLSTPFVLPTNADLAIGAIFGLGSQL